MLFWNTLRSQNSERNDGRGKLDIFALPPHGEEHSTWSVPGGGPQGDRDFVAAIPPMLADAAINVSPETAEACARAGFELSYAARSHRGMGAQAMAASALLARVEAVASSLVESIQTNPEELARAEAHLPTTKATRLTRAGLEALAAHLTAADRALGLGALAAAHTAPRTGRGGASGASYRYAQTWTGGSDLWPAGADYVPPRPERVAALMDDLVEFCARTDLDPVAQSAIAHAQFMSIQPFPDANGRAARTLINGVWRRRGLSSGLVVPISAVIAGDRRRYDSAWRAYREGDVEPMVALVARHALRAVKEASASAARVAAMPEQWRSAARPRRGSAAHALTALLPAHPIINAADVQRLTGASQASAYDAIARLADAGVLRRLTLSRRDTVWVAGDLLDEADGVLATLSGRRHTRPPTSTPRPRPSSSAVA